MSSYTTIFYHIVFSTERRKRVLGKTRRDDLYRFIWGVLQKRRCKLFRIGGVEDHIHILTSLHPAIALSDLVHELKDSSAAWIKGGRVFPDFSQWQAGCAVFTHSLYDKERLIEYIRTQEQRHKQISFREEYEMLLTEAGLTIHEHDEEWFDDDEGAGDPPEEE